MPAAAAHAAPAAQPVKLSDARTAPDYLRSLKPGRTVTVADGEQCVSDGHAALFSDVSAYRGRGGALGGQRWNADHDVTYWRAAYGGRVTFDGIAFRNATTRTVLVGGWC